jgi:alpha-ribazole phosphatase
MRCYLVRHPKPLVPGNTCYGSTDLTVHPDEQASVMAALFRTHPKGLPLFYSPLERCAGLAAGLADALGCASLNLDPRLVEMDFGKWELCAWDDIPRNEIDAWAGDTAFYRPGNAENVFDMARRIQAFHGELMRLQQDCIVICHAGPIRALLACRHHASIEQIAHVAAATPSQVGFGEVIRMEC